MILRQTNEENVFLTVIGNEIFGNTLSNRVGLCLTDKISKKYCEACG